MNPYETALRVQRREVDNVRLSISVAVEHATVIEQQQVALAEHARAERAVVADVRLPSDAWAARMRRERSRLDEQGRIAEAKLTHLRAQAMEAYGTMRAIEGASDRFHAEQERTIALAEQGRIDDLGAARFVKAAHAARKDRA